MNKNEIRKETKKETLQKLENLLEEAQRLYESNNRRAYESGRIDGVKWAIQAVLEMK